MENLSACNDYEQPQNDQSSKQKNSQEFRWSFVHLHLQVFLEELVTGSEVIVKQHDWTLRTIC